MNTYLSIAKETMKTKKKVLQFPWQEEEKECKVFTMSADCVYVAFSYYTGKV